MEVVCIIVNNIYLLACNVADNTHQHIYLVPPNRETMPAANNPEFTQHPLMHRVILHRCCNCCIHIILKPSGRNGGIHLRLLHSLKKMLWAE